MPRINANLNGLKTLIRGDFFDLAGLDKLTNREKEQIMLKMMESVKNRVILRIDEMIKKEDKAQFNALLDEGNDRKISQFIKDQGINIDEIVAGEAILLKKEMVEKLGTSNQ